MAQSHLTKEELRHDFVQDSLYATVDFLQRNLKWVIAGAAAVIIAVAGGIGYYVYAQYKANQESAAFYAAEKLLAQSDKKLEERLNQAESAFAEFVKTHPDSPLAPAAHTYLARFAFERKEYGKAEEAYQRALGHARLDSVQRSIVLLALGKLREAQGKPAEALTFYDRISDKRFEEAKAYAIGTAEMAAGKTEAARKQFQLAVTGQPGTSVFTWAKEALDYLP
jgi:predicted negative regulator of RcsB-dependent stress response